MSSFNRESDLRNLILFLVKRSTPKCIGSNTRTPKYESHKYASQKVVQTSQTKHVPIWNMIAWWMMDLTLEVVMTQSFVVICFVFIGNIWKCQIGTDECKLIIYWILINLLYPSWYMECKRVQYFLKNLIFIRFVMQRNIRT